MSPYDYVRDVIKRRENIELHLFLDSCGRSHLPRTGLYKWSKNQICDTKQLR